MISQLDFRLSAARVGHAHLCRLLEGLRTELVQAWLAENRSHPRARTVDALLSDFRLTGNPTDLDDAEIFTNRYPGSLS
jgi:hypothetical protein